MRVSAFCGVSMDGFLARPDDRLDFLATGEKEPHGFQEFLASVDVVLLGRKTFEVVASLGHLAVYGGKPVIVLSGKAPAGGAPSGLAVERLSGEPREITQAMERRGFRHAYLDGGLAIQRFLAAGCLHRLVITRVPVLIGRGIPLFGPVARDIPLRHLATRVFGGGLVQSEYEPKLPDACG